MSGAIPQRDEQTGTKCVLLYIGKKKIVLLVVGLGLIILILKIGQLFLILSIVVIMNILKFFGNVNLYLERQLTRGFSMYQAILFNNDKNAYVHWDFNYFDSALYILFFCYEIEMKENTHWYKNLIPICIKKNGRVIARSSFYDDSYKYVLNFKMWGFNG